MEFFLAFILSFLVLIAVSLAFLFGRPPTYRPKREDVLELLSDVVNAKASIERWDLFLSLPINHDPELEQIRQQCLIISFGDDGVEPAGEGVKGEIFDHRGRARVAELVRSLEVLIASEPHSRLF